MFKDEYNKQFEDVAPSPALNEETLALMKEAQAHPMPTAKPQKLRWVLPVCVSGAAAMLALTVGLGFWLKNPEMIDDIKGYNELFIWPGDSAFSEEFGSDSAVPNDTNKAVNDVENSDGDASSKSESNINDEEPSSNENKGADDVVGESLPPESTPEQDQGDGSAPEKPESDEPHNPEPIDPKAPVEMTDKKTETYLSLRAFLDAVAAKKTIGYKTNYLTEESLVIVPAWLPANARFRQVYAYSNGGYTYSYLMESESASYFLNVAVSATLPKTQRDLNLRVKGISEEERLLKKTQHQWTYYFGNYDKAIVTVTTIDGKFVSMDQVEPLLTNMNFARYTVQNSLVEMTY